LGLGIIRLLQEFYEMEGHGKGMGKAWEGTGTLDPEFWGHGII